MHQGERRKGKKNLTDRFPDVLPAVVASWTTVYRTMTSWPHIPEQWHCCLDHGLNLGSLAIYATTHLLHHQLGLSVVVVITLQLLPLIINKRSPKILFKLKDLLLDGMGAHFCRLCMGYSVRVVLYKDAVIFPPSVCTWVEKFVRIPQMETFLLYDFKHYL